MGQNHQETLLWQHHLNFTWTQQKLRTEVLFSIAVHCTYSGGRNATLLAAHLKCQQHCYILIQVNFPPSCVMCHVSCVMSHATGNI